jgi:xanthine dehydrogenase accessory factor
MTLVTPIRRFPSPPISIYIDNITVTVSGPPFAQGLIEGSLSMHESPPYAFLEGPYAIILGCNEIASAIAVRLTWERFRVVLSHDPFPPVIRRGMAFHDALFEDRAVVDGITGVRAETAIEIAQALVSPGSVAVTSQQFTDLVTLRTPTVLIDARMQKYRVTPDLRGLAPLAVGIGPKFTVGQNCDVAVETHPERTGSLVERGETLPADGVARSLGRAGKERFIYADRTAVWRTPLDVGALVFRGFVIGYLDDQPIRAPMDGHLRGIARDGTLTPGDAKLVEIDPRGRDACWTGTDERGRAVASAVVSAIETAPAHRRALTAEPSPH